MRVARYDATGKELLWSTTAPGVPNLTAPGASATLVTAVATAVGRSRPDPSGSIGHVLFAATGVRTRTSAAASLAAALQHRIGAAAVTVCSDALTAYVGAIGTRPGVVTVAGTGAIALAVDPRGGYRLVDGWGYLLGDAGSGYDIGRSAAAAALAAHDGRGPTTQLQEVLSRRFGDVEAVVLNVYGSPAPVRMLASLAVDVFDAAARGDGVSVQIVTRAAKDLARLAAAALAARGGSAGATAGQPEHSYAGSVFRSDLLRNLYLRELDALHPGSRLVPPAGDALAGGVRLVMEIDGPFARALLEGCRARVGSPGGTP